MSSDNSFDNGQKTAEPKHSTRFGPGNTAAVGKGRPRGARSKLAEDFVADALTAWKEHGKGALQVMATADPSKFCTMIANLLPKELNVTTGPAEELTADELDSLVASVKGLVAAAAASARANATPGAEPETKH